MSTGTKLPWAEAAEIAKRLSADLASVVVRVKVVGSVRRRKPEVGDIELLVEPKTMPDLLGGTEPDIDSIRMTVRSWGRIVKGGARYIQVAAYAGVQVDIFLCHPPAQWGSLLAIRTGPGDLGRHAVTRMIERGYRHEEGHVVDRAGNVIPTPEEGDFFRLAGLPCLPPRFRDTPAAFRPVGTGESR